MATSVVVTTSPVAAAQSTRVTRSKMFRGRRRTAIRKAIQTLRTILNQDNREMKRAAILDYPPALVSGNPGTAQARAFTTVLNRLVACQSLEWGDE